MLACEWETVLAALDDWAEGDRPLSYGTLPEDLAETRGTTVGYGHDYSIEDEPAASDTYGDWRDNEPPEPGASA